jgi:diadenosine tetraphosphate (Ap4A) HIT family hydrolase
MARPPPCPLCERVAKAANDPLLVTELETGVAFLFESQFYRGYTLFVSRRHATELFELKPAERAAFLEEMVRVARAVRDVFRPRKLNYELLGNVVPHLHWHIIPRHRDDPRPRAPIWELDERIRRGRGAAPDLADARALARRLR